MKKKKFDFHGNDFTEVMHYYSDKYNLGYPKSIPETTNKEFVQWLWDYCSFLDPNCDDNKQSREFLNPCRKFVDKLILKSKRNHYEHPLWIGLSEIKHDKIFLKYFGILFENLWT